MKIIILFKISDKHRSNSLPVKQDIIISNTYISHVPVF